MSPEEIVSLGTSIAIAITCDKSIAEIAEIRNIVNQINTTVQNIYNQHIINKKL